MFEESKSEPALGTLKEWSTGSVDLLDPDGSFVERLDVRCMIDGRAVRKEAGAITLAQAICAYYTNRLDELGAGPGWKIRFTDTIPPHWGQLTEEVDR